MEMVHDVAVGSLIAGGVIVLILGLILTLDEQYKIIMQMFLGYMGLAAITIVCLTSLALLA